MRTRMESTISLSARWMTSSVAVQSSGLGRNASAATGKARNSYSSRLGAPASLQAAVAAGLLGLGGRYGGTVEGAARMLQEGLAGTEPDARLREVARAIVSRHREQGQLIPGLGHPTHKGVDPRVPRLFQ